MDPSKATLIKVTATARRGHSLHPVLINLADPACEEALYDSANLRCFVGIKLGREPAPYTPAPC